MAHFTNLLEERALDWSFNIGSPTRPSSLYVVLFTADPTEAGSWSNELSGTGYSRQSVTFSRSAQTLTPASAVTFGPNSGSSAWTQVTYFGIADSSTAGNLLAYNSLTTPRSVGPGDSATFATSALTITLD